MEVANSSLESPGALQKFSKLIWRYHVCPFISIILSISQEKKSLLPPKTHCIDQAGRTTSVFSHQIHQVLETSQEFLEQVQQKQ